MIILIKDDIGGQVSGFGFALSTYEPFVWGRVEKIIAVASRKK